MCGRLRRSRRARDAQEGRPHAEALSAHVEFLHEDARDAEEVHQRQVAHGHDAGRAFAAIRRRRGFVHGLRRRYGAPHDARGDGFCLRQGKHRYRQFDRLLDGLCLDVSLQSVSRAVDEFALRERARRRHGHPRALGSNGLARQTTLGHRWRRCDARHRLPKPEPHVGQRHEHQGARARHAGLFQHRRAIVHRHVHGPEHEVQRSRHKDSRQDRAAQRTRPDLHDAPEHVRGADQLCDVESLLQIHHRCQRIRRPGGGERLYDVPARTRRRRQHGRTTRRSRATRSSTRSRPPRRRGCSARSTPIPATRCSPGTPTSSTPTCASWRWPW